MEDKTIEKIINNEDSKDAKIVNLLKLINKFKKYDKERTKLLNAVQFDLDYYSDMYITLKNEVSDKEVFEALQTRVKELKSNCRVLAKQNENFRRQLELVKDKQLLEDSLKVIDNYDVILLKKQNDTIKEKLKSLRNDYDTLMNKYLQYKIKDMKENNIKPIKFTTNETQN